MFDLISTNGGCSLPCVWGIRPGESTVDSIGTTLAPVSEHFETPEWFHYPRASLDGPRRRPDFARLVIEPGPPPDPLVLAVDYSLHITGYDETGAAYSSEDVRSAASRFTLDHILAELGVPDRVLLREAIPDRILGSLSRLPGGVGLFYEDTGVAIYLVGAFTPVSGGQVVHCFDPSALRVLNVFTHAPDDGNTLADILDRFVGGMGVPFEEYVRRGVFIDVEAATGVSAQEFYDIYKTPTSRCLESPLEIWTSE